MLTSELQRISPPIEPPGKEARLQEILDSCFNWEYLIEPGGRLGYISPACKRISGYPPEEFSKNPELLSAIIHPEDRPIVGGHFPETTALHDGPGLEFRIIAKSGEIHWILHHCQLLVSRSGEKLGIRGTNLDITVAKNQILTSRTQVEKRLAQLNNQLINIQEEERRRISQDLHDDTGQEMTALLLRLNAIHTSLDPEQYLVREQLGAAIQIVEGLMNQVRQLAYQLRPPSLDSVPLSKALESLCTSFGQNAGMRVDFSSDADLPPIPNLQATALYRMVQEGLNNAIKYAQASMVWVNLDYLDGEVSCSVEDNGQGFDLNKIGGGMGLIGLQERFRLLNGGLEIESAPNEGTRLVGFLPLASHNL